MAKETRDGYGYKRQRVFAWLPKKLQNGRWVWLRFVTRTHYIW